MVMLVRMHSEDGDGDSLSLCSRRRGKHLRRQLWRPGWDKQPSNAAVVNHGVGGRAAEVAERRRQQSAMEEALKEATGLAAMRIKVRIDPITPLSVPSASCLGLKFTMH